MKRNCIPVTAPFQYIISLFWPLYGGDKYSTLQIYHLSKFHKAGKSMRPIITAVCSLTYNLGKTLTIEFENSPDVHNRFSMKNSIEFIDSLY